MSAAQKLFILKDGQPFSELEVRHEVSLGRDEGNLVHLRDRAISRKHAVITPSVDGLQILKKSKFGLVSVNGSDITQATLKTGDIIQMGPYQIRVGSRVEAPLENSARSLVPELAINSMPLDESGDEQIVQSPDLNLEGANAFADGGVSVGELPVSEAGPFTDPEPVEPTASIEEAGPITLASSPVNSSDDHAIEQFSIGDPVPGALSTSKVEEIQISHSDSSDFDGDGKTRLTALSSIKVMLLFTPGTANVRELEIGEKEIVIGRGKECDVVLNDKKSSRKHATIRREGMQFFLRDLGSSNGTFLDDEQIQDVVALSGEHRVRIGDVEFEFKASSSAFDGLPSSSENTPALVSGTDLPHYPMGDPAADTGIPAFNGDAISGMPGAPTANESKSLVAKFRKLPKRKQLVYGLVGLAIIASLVGEQEEPKKPAPTPASTTAKKPAAGGNSFEALNPEQKRFVETQYQLGLELYKAHEYDKTLFELRKIFQLIPEYKDAKELERYALEGKRVLEAQLEEKRRKEEEEQRKERIQSFVERAQKFMDQKNFDQAQGLFPEILALDPENTLIPKWQSEIDQVREQIKIKADLKRIAADKLMQAEEIFSAGLEKKGRLDYWGAIEEFEKVEDLQLNNPPMNRKVQTAIDQSMAAVDEMLKPVLDEAKRTEDAKNYAESFKLYEKATQIHPGREEGYKGMERTRGTLHEKAKQVYVEAIVAESYSDFETARRKFSECQRIAPTDDEYYDKSTSKLKRYELVEGRAPAGLSNGPSATEVLPAESYPESDASIPPVSLEAAPGAKP